MQDFPRRNKNPHSLGKSVHFDKLIPLIIDKPNQWRKVARFLHRWKSFSPSFGTVRYGERREWYVNRLRAFLSTKLPDDVKSCLKEIAELPENPGRALYGMWFQQNYVAGIGM